MTPQHAAAGGRNSHCAICGNALSFHERWASDICSDWRCRWRLLDSEIEAYRREAARVLCVKHPEDYRALVVPHRLGTLAKLPSRRHAEHLRLLQEVVRRATLDASGDEAQVCKARVQVIHEPPHPLAGAVCAVCGGACCHRGGDQAFLDVADIEKTIAVNPGTGPAGIVATYASQLPVRSIAGSCVYHTSDGCALPRHLRADICNAHCCRGLKQAERWIRDHGATRLYVVARENNVIQRSAFVEAGNIRHYPPTDAIPDSGQPSHGMFARHQIFN